jgi:hypothetical protein
MFDPTWVSDGKANGHKYLIVVCDSFDYEDYPVYCDTDVELEQKTQYYRTASMQRIMETIVL